MEVTPRTPESPLIAQIEGLSPEQAREILQRLATEVPDKVRTAIEQTLASEREPTAPTVTVTPPTSEAIPEPKTLSFSEASELFGRNRIDVGGKVVEGLLAGLKETIKMYGRMGLDEALKQKGSSLDKFGAQLQDSTQLNIADLQQIFASANAEGVVQFDLVYEGGPLLPHELWNALFEKPGIPHWKNTYGLNNLHLTRRVSQAHFKEGGYDLARLADIRGSHMPPFQAAYKNAPEWTQSGGRLIFTPNTAEATRTGISATKDLADGVRTLDIDANMVRFRTFMEEGLRMLAKQQDMTDEQFDNLRPADYNKFMKKCLNDGSIYPFLPDKTTISRSSRCAFPNGGVAALGWYPGYREVDLYDYYPDCDDHYLGSRSASG